jgi:uncharacterized membrane protein
MLTLVRKDIATIIISAVTMILLDFIYLSTAGKYFQTLVKKIQGSPIKFNMLGAVLCYVFLVGVINHFILLNKKLNKKEKLRDAFLLGLAIYAVFEFTNLAIFKGWTWKAVIMDSVWGSILFLLVTWITLKILK